MAIGSVPVEKGIIRHVTEAAKGWRLEGFLLGWGKWPTKMMFVGEAPGAKEAKEGKPFIGQAGQVLDGYMKQIGLSREEIYITSAVRSRPYRDKEVRAAGGTMRISRSNRTPTAKEVLTHAPVLDAEIAAVQPVIIVPLGNIALKRLIGDTCNITDLHGQSLNQSIRYAADPWDAEKGYMLSEKKYIIFPMYHPAAVMYNRKLSGIIESDLKLLRTLYQNQDSIEPD